MNHHRSLFSRGSRFVICLLLMTIIGTSLLLGQRKGSLLVLADSGSTVYVNGQYQGLILSAQDGLEVGDLRPGVYGVVLRRSGAESEEFKVEVKAARRSTLEKRAFRTLPVPEGQPSRRLPDQGVRKDSSGGVVGAERFVGLWREQRTGTFGNAHFTVAFQGGKFVVQRLGGSYDSDLLTSSNTVERGGARSTGVVKLEGKVRHYGGTISMTLTVQGGVWDPLKDPNSETLAVQYLDVAGAGATFEGTPTGVWVRMKQ